MGIESINEPGPGSRTWMVNPPSINEPPTAPVVTDMSPDSCTIGDPSFNLVFTGSNFDPLQCFIAFAGHREPARFNEDGSVYTIINMDTWFGPDTVQAAVFNGNQPSQWFDFTFNAATLEAAGADIEDPSDPDELEDEIEQAAEEGDFKPTHTTHHRKPAHKKGKR